MFHEREGLALVTIGACSLPECEAAAAPLAYRACGNEPFWQVRVTGREARLFLPGEEAPHRAALAEPREAAGGTLHPGISGDTPFSWRSPRAPAATRWRTPLTVTACG